MNSGIHLPSLGIAELDQQRVPTSTSFPKSFNQGNQHIWDSALTYIEPHMSVVDAWHAAIHAYIDNCVAQERYPFSNFKQTVNDLISEELTKGRRMVVKFLNRNGLLNHITILRTARKVCTHSKGFVLRVEAPIRIRDEGLIPNLTHIPMPGFGPQRDGVFYRKLSSTVTMYIYNEGVRLSQRWHLAYEISVDNYPHIYTNHTPNKAEIQQFINDIIWMPILRGNRPRGGHHRLI